MRRIAATALGTAALLGILATPASADPIVPNPLSLVPSTLAPVGNWTWTAIQRVQSYSTNQNGLVNLSNNGNLCVGLLGVLAPSTPCTNS